MAQNDDVPPRDFRDLDETTRTNKGCTFSLPLKHRKQINKLRFDWKLDKPAHVIRRVLDEHDERLTRASPLAQQDLSEILDRLAEIKNGLSQPGKGDVGQIKAPGPLGACFQIVLAMERVRTKICYETDFHPHTSDAPSDRKFKAACKVFLTKATKLAKSESNRAEFAFYIQAGSYLATFLDCEEAHQMFSWRGTVSVHRDPELQDLFTFGDLLLKADPSLPEAAEFRAAVDALMLSLDKRRTAL